MNLDHFLHQSVVVLGAAVLVLLVSHRFKVPPIVGLLLTGLAIGPSASGLVSDAEAIHVLAEIGVVLLLFVIGLELSFGKLKEVGRPFLVGGSVQALVTTAIGALAATAAGLRPGSAVFYGFVLTLSSTAIVLKLLGDRREMEAPHGRVSLAILIFQDFLIVPMIVLTPVLAGAVAASPAELAQRFGGSLAAVALVFVAARYLMPRLFHQFALTRVREVFVLGALGICLAMSWLTHSFGFSLALGAFLAGILVSETEYSHQVVAEILPFRDVFASVFFVSIGMLVDLQFVAQHAVVVFGLALAVVVAKALACALAVAVLRFPLRTVVGVALGLAQIGEFSFVLMEVGHSHGLLQGDRYQLVLSAAVLTMLVTPALSQLGPAALLKLYARFDRRKVESDGDETAATAGRSGHVIVIGYGHGGSLLARVLRETRTPYVVIELNSEIVRRARSAGEPILFGDATRVAILEHADVETASVVVFAVSDPVAVRYGVRLARDLSPSAQILVRTRAVGEIAEIQQLGADQVVAEEFETAIEIFTRVLARFHVPRNIVRAQTRLMRGEGYRMLRAPSLAAGASEKMLEALVEGTTDVFRVEAGSSADGRTLKQLDLRRESGASVVAVVRGETSFPNPSADLVLEVGDDLVLVGNHAEVDGAFALLEAEVTPADP